MLTLHSLWKVKAEVQRIAGGGGKMSKQYFLHIKLYSHYKIQLYMRLALDSLHSVTRWQHTAVNMLKSMRRSSLDVTTWTHVEETQHRRQFTDDSAPTFRWLRFTLVHLLIFIYLFIFFGGGGSATAIGTGTESKKFSGEEKRHYSKFSIPPFPTPTPMPCWSHYSQILQNRGKKYKVLMITKWTSITVAFL